MIIAQSVGLFATGNLNEQLKTELFIQKNTVIFLKQLNVRIVDQKEH